MYDLDITPIQILKTVDREMYAISVVRRISFQILGMKGLMI